MYRLEILNLENKTIFEKWFYSLGEFKKFKNKCKYSKKIKIINIIDYSKLYD